MSEHESQIIKPLDKKFVKQFISDMITTVFKNAIISTDKDTGGKTARIITNSVDNADKISNNIDKAILSNLNQYIRDKLQDNPKNYNRNVIQYSSIIKGTTIEIKY